MLRIFVGPQQNWPAIKWLCRILRKALPPMHTTYPKPFYPQVEDKGPFTQEEPDNAIDLLTRNKAGGTNELMTELFNDMKPLHRGKLLGLYTRYTRRNKSQNTSTRPWWSKSTNREKIPEHYASFRPIALLNVMYKMHAKMLQERLRTSIDARIVEVQFGYRQGKSTAEHIFVAQESTRTGGKTRKTPIHAGSGLLKSFWQHSTRKISRKPD